MSRNQRAKIYAASVVKHFNQPASDRMPVRKIREMKRWIRRRGIVDDEAFGDYVDASAGDELRDGLWLAYWLGVPSVLPTARRLLNSPDEKVAETSALILARVGATEDHLTLLDRFAHAETDRDLYLLNVSIEYLDCDLGAIEPVGEKIRTDIGKSARRILVSVLYNSLQDENYGPLAQRAERTLEELLPFLQEVDPERVELTRSILAFAREDWLENQVLGDSDEDED